MREAHSTIFTDQFLRSLKPAPRPYKRAELAPKGEGRLTVRVLPSGSKEFFYRYRVNGNDRMLALGRFDPQGKTGVTLAQVRETLKATRALQRATGDVKAHQRTEERRAEIEARKGTLRQLLAAYVQSLRDANKPSAYAAEHIFERHVTKAFPRFVDLKANEVLPEHIGEILAKMVKAGITRQVNKTRAYLRAAFAYGAKADHDPRTLARDGALFALRSNPVSLTPVIREYERTRERTLNEDELRAFWKALDSLPVIQGATLRFNLALGCQRPTQLLRAAWTAFDSAEKTLLLKDSKGRGGSRDHLLPLTPFALEQLKALREANGQVPSPFTSDGKRQLAVDTLSSAVRHISQSLQQQHEIPPFQLRDLRRTAETMLQKLAVDREVRAHLLSHGRGQGVQGRHYERYDFLPEKRAALEKWSEHLRHVFDPKRQAKVVSIRNRAA